MCIFFKMVKCHQHHLHLSKTIGDNTDLHNFYSQNLNDIIDILISLREIAL